MMTRPSANQVKASYNLWVQYVDANTTVDEFNSMTEQSKDSWLSLFGWEK